MKIRSLINKLRGDTDIPSLVKKGLTIGENVFVNFGCIIDESFCWLIKIGDNTVLAPNVHILAHDASTKKALGYTKVGGVNIGSNVFIGAGSIILPGVNVSDNVIIGAGSVVTKDIPENSVVVGNPAKIVCSYLDYMEKHNIKLAESPKFSYKPDKLEQKKIKEYLSNNRIGYIE